VVFSNEVCITFPEMSSRTLLEPTYLYVFVCEPESFDDSMVQLPDKIFDLRTDNITDW